MSKLLLNLGSGQRPFEKPWINVDSQSRWEPDVCCDASCLPFEDESAEIVVLHHVLEHFGCGEGRGLVEEAHRVLTPGGRLIVTVPDARRLAQMWLMGKMSDQLYFTN